MTSHCYDFQVLWFPDSLGLLWHCGESEEICMPVCHRVCVCAHVCASLYAWRGSDGKKKEVWTKKGGSIIGFSTARRHNDTAIDSGMSSRERWTNGGAGVCFSQPLIGWPREAVGLQVAKWTSEHIPAASWRREGRGGEGRICDLMCGEEKTRHAGNIESLIFCMYPLPHHFYMNCLSSFSLTQTCCVCVGGWVGCV